MNSNIEKLIREELTRKYELLPDKNKDFFCRLYGSVETIDAEKMDLAMTQIDNTLKKLNDNATVDVE